MVIFLGKNYYYKVWVFPANDPPTLDCRAIFLKEFAARQNDCIYEFIFFYEKYYY